MARFLDSGSEKVPVVDAAADKERKLKLFVKM